MAEAAAAEVADAVLDLELAAPYPASSHPRVAALASSAHTPETVADANAAQAAAAEGGEAASLINLFISFPSPDAAAFDAALSAVRGTPGITGASVSSTAIGGTSVMSVTYQGTLDELVGAIAARGYNVQRNGTNLTISR